MNPEERARLEALGYSFELDPRPSRSTAITVQHGNKAIGKPAQPRAARAWYYALKMAKEHSEGAIFRY